jgi:hypothetical protein
VVGVRNALTLNLNLRTKLTHSLVGLFFSSAALERSLDRGGMNMHSGIKLALAATMTVMASGPTFASFWQCVPEIDGSAGVSALALLGCFAMIAYNRLSHRRSQ